MSSISGLGTGVTRRIAQSPQMRSRIQSALTEITTQVHARRIRQWAQTNEGSFPKMSDSTREATEELALLCAALGPQVDITPQQFDRACWLMQHPDGRNHSC